MFQLVHDYNALQIQGAVEFLDIQHYCGYFIIYWKLLIVLIINKTFLIFKSNNMRMFDGKGSILTLSWLLADIMLTRIVFGVVGVSVFTWLKLIIFVLHAIIFHWNVHVVKCNVWVCYIIEGHIKLRYV